MSTPLPQQKQKGLLNLLGPYKGIIALLTCVTIIPNIVSLLIPQIVGHAIDSYTLGIFMLSTTIWQFSLATITILIFTILQSTIQTYASERVARDMRTELSAKISHQSYGYIQTISPAKLLTNLTGDIDSVKSYISLAIVTIISSIVLIIGASTLLFVTNWRLALVVLTIIPLIGGTFFFVFGKVKTLFTKSREVIDWLNKVINESILGSALIRVLNSNNIERTKFEAANTQAKDIGMSILSLFATMIPLITFISNLAIFSVLTLGGHFVIAGSMTLGNFAAFNSYISILIFPIIILGFMSNVIAQASSSYARVRNILEHEEKKEFGTITERLKGNITIKDVTVAYGDKIALKNISLSIQPHTKTAIIGPTAGGKSQLLYLLIGLIEPNSGIITFDGKNVDEYNKENLHADIGFVFQDSVMFNLSIRENIAFGQNISDENLDRAIKTSELSEFITTLPHGLESVVSERGTTLSGGQKQRIMLARALALNPHILLLDDFTARVDRNTEEKILANIAAYYPDITLISVTQKITAVEHYDQIVLLMEGEILATGTHENLMKTSPEYVQIYNSQQSTHTYESPHEK